MPYSVIISPQAEKDLENLESSVSKRIKKKLKEIKKNVNELGIDPDHYFDWINKYKIHKLQIGDYRIFSDIDKEKKEIKIITVMRRDKAYKGWG